MTDYEYILQEVKKAHYSGWDDAELIKCVDMLEDLSRQELTFLYYSRWVKEDKVFRVEIDEADAYQQAVDHQQLDPPVPVPGPHQDLPDPFLRQAAAVLLFPRRGFSGRWDG